MSFLKSKNLLNLLKSQLKFRNFYLSATLNSVSPNSSLPGIIFDIDGVLTRGGTTLPNTIPAFNTLFDTQTNNFKIPIVFVTNAGNVQNHTKAESLTKILGYPIQDEQVIMSHTPLQMLIQQDAAVGEKFSLICGQGPISKIAQQLGFKNCITIEELRNHFPYLDIINQDTRVPNPEIFNAENSNSPKIPLIEQVILFGEPKNWETNLQLVLDCLVSHGDFWQRRSQIDYENQGVLNYEISDADLTYPQLPVIAANMDLQWQAEAPGPRFGHGMFMQCLQSSYKKLTGGRELKYSALAGKPATLTYKFAEDLLVNIAETEFNSNLNNVYCIGDNLMSDIAGANMYQNYKMNQRRQMLENLADNANETAAINSEEMRNFLSMLVCTGVYHPESRENLKVLKQSIKSININHAPRDYQDEILQHKSLLRPNYLFEDVNDCIKYIFYIEQVEDRIKQLQSRSS